ncbi:hypothetical protein niasHT_002842 [Heterodera trifolii]|uniref:Chromo domain-containing protein n=1 Tax=Heterodera trifolii TaxID=157864 RepID=A0ABD2LQK2_9BILA
MEADDGPGQRVHRRSRAALFQRKRGATPLHAHLTPVARRDCGTGNPQHQGATVSILHPPWHPVLDRCDTALSVGAECVSAACPVWALRPRDVNFANAEQIRRQQLESSKHVRGRNPRPPRFNAGDRVRIEKHKLVFKKGYLPRFTDEVFTVAEVRDSRTPTTYKLRDDNGELLTGWFYAQDLCLVLPPPAPPQHPTQQGAETPAAVDAAAAVVGPVYDIERVLKRRRQGRNGVEHCLVKWKDYSTSHNSWIPATSII